jgi:L-fuconolactonase
MLKGLRPMLQDLSDPDWILQPAVQPVLSAMARCGLVFDALIKTVHIPRILALTQAHPDLTVVVDHGAKPVIDTAAMDDWAQAMTQLARATDPAKVVCKMSGLWTEAPAGQPVEVVRPWCEALLTIWGPQRLLWGSDWPVLELAGSYAAWRELSLSVLAHLPEQEKNAVLGGNARRIYRLEG